MPDGLTLNQLRSVIGRTYQGAKIWAASNGYKYTRENDRMGKREMQLKTMPPGLTLTELATRLGCSRADARSRVALFGYQLAKPDKIRAEYDWKSVNWEKPDALIASETGITRERIRQVRRQLGKPRSPYHRIRLPSAFCEWKWPADKS